jgi:GNAT superfamily N-acetyltransferase
VEFRSLRKEDDRSRFSCGNGDLDTFFRRFAGQNQFRHQIGVTYVFADASGVAAFVTVAAHSLKLPDGQRGSLPDYQLPVLLIARLGVDAGRSGQGLGKRLLRECCALAVEQSERFGCVGLATDAKADAVEFYRRFGFTPLADPTERGTQLHFLALRHFLAEVKARSPA